MTKPMIVIQTDFTYKEGAVAAMKGVMKSVDASLDIIDLTHEIPQFDVYSASFRLHQVIPFWPSGTIFVSVVDPGVGTYRKACIALTLSNHYIITPDNQTLSHVAQHIGIKSVRELDPKHRFISKYTSSVFHGRDIFGYCAALLASGKLTYEDLGIEYLDFQHFDIPNAIIKQNTFKGIIEIQDQNFGNCWTNIPLELIDPKYLIEGSLYLVEVHHLNKLVFSQSIPFYRTFGKVTKGQAVLYGNELGCIALGLNQANLIKQFDLGFGIEWIITLIGEDHE
ncbi:MAG: SAM-dependent chlorinase/fluorinase [Erysipelotrichaceae bacterium]